MKKIFISVACVLALASCADHSKMPAHLYCEKDASRLYNNPEAELDTLSYAAGMNLGLVLSIQNADFDIDVEEIIAVLDRELAKDFVEQKELDKHNQYLSEFSNARVRPYMMAKQTNSRIKTDCPDTLSLPAIYDETYTQERFVNAFGAMMANAVRTQHLPANLYWVFEAMRDADKVTDRTEIDSVMRITEQQLIATMTNYTQKELSGYNSQLANNWYNRVATMEGVESMCDDTNTPIGVYYRINNRGGELCPVNATDSIAVKYAVYSRTGRLLESNQTFIDNLQKQRKQTLENKMLPDSLRTRYLKQIDEEIAKSDIRKLPLNRFLQKDIQNAMKLIGKGGSITIWMDAVRALGYRANRILPVNEGVVINIELLDVKTNIPMPTPRTVTSKAIITDESKGEQSQKASTVLPVKKLSKPAKQ